jgi:hypothetical protein
MSKFLNPPRPSTHLIILSDDFDIFLSSAQSANLKEGPLSLEEQFIKQRKLYWILLRWTELRFSWEQNVHPKQNWEVTCACSEVKSINLSTYLNAKLNFQKTWFSK